jgi:hypothetical protein
MRNRLSSKVKGLPSACLLACLLVSPCHAQKVEHKGARAAKAEQQQVSPEDASGLTARVKSVESSAFRAYLNTHLATWLWQSADKSLPLRQLAVETSVAGLNDLWEHEREIPAASAGFFYREMLNVIRQNNPEEAERLKQSKVLRREVEATDSDKAGASLHSAILSLNNPQAAAGGVERAANIIETGRVPAQDLLGELLALNASKSPALPQLLDATLRLMERDAAALPLRYVFFISHVYLQESTPAAFQVRFLNACVNAVRALPAESRRDPVTAGWAAKLLERAMPSIQKLTPGAYAEAAAQLVALSPGANSEEAVYERVRNSPDQLAAAITEADAASDVRLKAELLKLAARLAKERGKLRQAADLITSVEEERAGLPEGYSARDEFLDDVSRLALQQKDAETARYAVSKMGLPLYRVEGLRAVARYFVEARDLSTAREILSEAVKGLDASPEGPSKSISYLGLAADFDKVDGARAFEIAAEAIKSVNNITRPREDPDGEVSWRLFSVADNITKTFRQLALRDRPRSLGMSESFQPREFKIAAALGVYSASASEPSTSGTEQPTL